MLWIVIGFFVVGARSLAAMHELFPGASIQQAVLQSDPGDTILLNDGLYAETVVFYGQVVTLASRFLLDGDSSHIANTVITPDFLRPDTLSCLVYAYDESYTNRVVGVTLTGGRGTFWSEPRVASGGAIHARMVPLSLEHCDIEHSEALCGGGVAFMGRTERGLLGTVQDAASTIAAPVNMVLASMPGVARSG